MLAVYELQAQQGRDRHLAFDGEMEREPGRRKIGWVQAIYPLRAWLQELNSIHLLPEKWNDTLKDELTELKKGEQAFLYTRPKFIQTGYTTLDSILRIQKGSRTRFYCPALKGIDSKTQDTVSRWIQLLHKHPAHLHALDIKDARKQRDPSIKPLEGITTSKLADKYIVKRNKIRKQCTLLRGQVEEGVAFFLDKVAETASALTWKMHGSPQGDRKVKETMYSTASRILGNRTMARQLEHGRHPELPHPNPNTPRGNQGDEPHHLERGRRSCNRISLHTETTDQKDLNCREQTPDLTMVVRLDDITPTSSAKT